MNTTDGRIPLMNGASSEARLIWLAQNSSQVSMAFNQYLWSINEDWETEGGNHRAGELVVLEPLTDDEALDGLYIVLDGEGDVRPASIKRSLTLDGEVEVLKSVRASDLTSVCHARQDTTDLPISKQRVILAKVSTFYRPAN